MVYEFKDPDILGHRKCTVYDIKVKGTVKYLICVICGKECGWYEDSTPTKEYPQDSRYYTDKNLDKWK